MRVLITGSNGQLGSEIKELENNYKKVDLIFKDLPELDICNFEALQAFIIDHNINAVINCAAYTAVDKAESDVDNAFMLNAKAAGNFARACKALTIPFVHISTDFVFHGDKGSPYLPTDEINPLGVYGASKAQGEHFIADVYPERSCIIRTSWVYSIHGNNFVKTMLNLMNTKPELGVISDQIGSPTYAKGLAKVCIASLTDKINGIHHYTDTGVASWFDFAVAIQRMGLQLGLLDKKIPIKPITTAQYPTPAKRPHYSVLDKSSLASALPEFKFSHWQEQLHTMMTALKAEQS